MSHIPNDKTAPRVRARVIAGARLPSETEDQTRARLEKDAAKVAAALRQTTDALRAELAAARARLGRQRAARQVDGSAMGDALTALITPRIRSTPGSMLRVRSGRASHPP